MKAVRSALKSRLGEGDQLSLSGYWAAGRAEDAFQAEKRQPVGPGRGNGGGSGAGDDCCASDGRGSGLRPSRRHRGALQVLAVEMASRWSGRAV